MSDDVFPNGSVREVERLRGDVQSIVAYGRRQVDLEVERGLEGAARSWRHVVHIAEEALVLREEDRTR